MNLEISLEDERWHDLERLALPAFAAALTHCGIDPEICEISLLGCDDARIAELNAQYREKPSPTNVLSWPTEDLAASRAGALPSPPEPDFTGDISLGDIAISFDTCAREALAAGKNMGDHVTHLLVHAVLHLLGYDHIRDPDATLMEATEVEILGKLGMDNPYNE